MSETPKKLFDRPQQADEQPFDVLGDVVDSVRLGTLLYGQFELTAPWGVRFPNHPEAHLHVVARGGGRLEIASTPPIVLAAGDLVVLPNGGEYVLRDSPASAVQVFFPGERTRSRVVEPIRLGGGGAPTLLVAAAFSFGARRARLLDGLPPVIHVPAHQGAEGWLPATIQLLLAESAARSPAGTVVLSRLVEILFVQALRTRIREGKCEHIRALADPAIAQALALIHDRPAAPWTNESLAEKVGLSRSGFAARFRELVGQPPLEYLTELRMVRAAQMLGDPMLSIAEIAEGVGYANEASFNRAFKRWDGAGPGAYRRRTAGRVPAIRDDLSPNPSVRPSR